MFPTQCLNPCETFFKTWPWITRWSRTAPWPWMTRRSLQSCSTRSVLQQALHHLRQNLRAGQQASPFAIIDTGDLVLAIIIGVSGWIGLILYFVPQHVVFDGCQHDAIGDIAMRAAFQLTPQNIITGLLADSKNRHSTVIGLLRISNVGHVQKST